MTEGLVLVYEPACEHDWEDLYLYLHDSSSVFACAEVRGCMKCGHTMPREDA